MERKPEDLVPRQQTGNESNTEAVEVFEDSSSARSFYTIVKNRLLNVNNWHYYAGKLTARFQLTDAEGNEVKRGVQKGDYFKIDIPGPGSATGEGYDWVQIEAIEEQNSEESDCIAIRVRPASNPQNDRPDVAHFFSEEATSSFMVKREGAKVIAAVYGRNEKPNTGADETVDKARNTAIATGAITGFSKLQWKSLVTGLIKQEA